MPFQILLYLLEPGEIAFLILFNEMPPLLLILFSKGDTSVNKLASQLIREMMVGSNALLLNDGMHSNSYARVTVSM